MKQITDAERIAATLTLGLKSTVDADGRVTIFKKKSQPTRSGNFWLSTDWYTCTGMYVTDCTDWRKSMVGGE
jgi:hypothetical protein